MLDTEKQKQISDSAKDISQKLDSVELSVEDSNNAVNGLKDVSVNLLKGNIPAKIGILNVLSGAGLDLETAEEQDLSIEELRYAVKKQRLVDRKLERENRELVLEMKSKKESIEKSLLDQVRKTSSEDTVIESSSYSSSSYSAILGVTGKGNGSETTKTDILEVTGVQTDAQIQFDNAVVTKPGDERSKGISEQMKLRSSEGGNEKLEIMMKTQNGKNLQRRKLISKNQRRKRDLQDSNLNSTANSTVSEMSLSSFKVTTKDSAAIIVLQPDSDIILDVYIKANKKPTHEIHDFHFSLPHQISLQNMDEKYDIYKIFLSTEQIKLFSKKLYSQPLDFFENSDNWYVGVIQGVFQE